MKTYTMEEIKDMVEKAEGSDWAIEAGKKNDELYIQSNDHGRVCRLWNGRTKRDGNAKFIAASRTIVPQLVEWVEKLMNLLKESSDFDMTKEVHLEDWRYGEDTWTEDEMKLIIRWQKGRIQYGARQLEKAIKTFKDIRDFGLGKFKGTLDAKLAHSILMADLTLKELGVE